MEEEKISEFIGIMLGDGSIGIYDTKAGDKIKKHHVVKVSLDSRNTQYTMYVYELMKDVLKVEPKIHSKKKENAVDICTFRKETIFHVLNNMGLKISPKLGRMEIPKKYMKEDLFPFIIRGLFDTDGSVTIFNNNGTIYPRIEIRICPSPAQNQVMNILDSLGFKYTVQKLEKEKIRIRISRKEELKRWFDIIGSSNELYIKRFERFFEKKVL